MRVRIEERQRQRGTIIENQYFVPAHRPTILLFLLLYCIASGKLKPMNHLHIFQNVGSLPEVNNNTIAQNNIVYSFLYHIIIYY